MRSGRWNSSRWALQITEQALVATSTRGKPRLQPRLTGALQRMSGWILYASCIIINRRIRLTRYRFCYHRIVFKAATKLTWEPLVTRIQRHTRDSWMKRIHRLPISNVKMFERYDIPLYEFSKGAKLTFTTYLETRTAIMKPFAAPIAISAVVFITMLQHCPAPIITTLAIVGTGALQKSGSFGLYSRHVEDRGRRVGEWQFPHALQSP